MNFLKEISLNILDIAKNSVKADATLIIISVVETENELMFEITDNGFGMSAEMIKNVTDPFCTTRTTRKVGLGIPLLRLAAEQTGGGVEITSREKAEYPSSCGTTVRARFVKTHIDFTPLGDIVSTICTLIQGSPDIDFVFSHTGCGYDVHLSTAEMREALGPDIPLSAPEVIEWTYSYLKEQYQSVDKK